MDDTVKAIARPAPTRSLREGIRQARLEEAGRLDQAADRRDSEMARLELLRAELESVFAELPGSDDRFCFALVPSKPARLWIDLFTYAAVDEANGTYLFIRNSETGRRTLFSAPSVSGMADRITDYMAREIVRRERQEAALLEPVRREDRAPCEEVSSGSGAGVAIAAFVIGLITGVVGLFAAVWLTVP
jgi:hypothetical protein